MSMSSSGQKRSRRGRGGRMSEINVTPMVDVMLVLLIIFMVTAPMLSAGVNVDLPETNASPSRSDGEPLEISVDKNGDIFLAAEKVEIHELPGKLQAINDIDPKKLVYLRGDRQITYGIFAEVMGEINAAGFTRITLLTTSK